MDFFFSKDNLNRMTPEETRITSLTAEPYPDGHRLRVNIEVTPFQKRPHIGVVLKDVNGDEVASANIVEPLGWKLEFTLHIRAEELRNPYTLEATLYYPDGPSQMAQVISFDVKPSQTNSLTTKDTTDTKEEI